MPRFKPIDIGMKLPPIDLSAQLLPGTFEHAPSLLVDQELDLSPPDKRSRNDESGGSAYALSVMLKFIPYTYSRGMIRSRDIAQAWQQRTVLMNFSGDTIPQFTALASFVCARTPFSGRTTLAL